MNAERLRLGLLARGCPWPFPIEAFASLASTNDCLRSRGRSLAAWAVVLAESQSAGRGRRGHAWVSPPGNLYLSVALPPPGAPDRAGLIPLVAGVAAAEALAEFQVQAQLKWPNDLEAGGLKLGGILAEGSSSGGGLDAVVLGLGVNVREDPGRSDPELRGQATSIATLTGAAPDTADVGAAFLARLFARYAELQAGSTSALLHAWRARSVPWWGQPVEVVSGGEAQSGTALDVDAEGALLLKRADGEVVRVLAGEARAPAQGARHALSESAYYQAIEEFFVGKRGDPLFLSNSDWVLVHKWRREGVPLRIVLRGIADAFEGHALSWGRERKVGSLSYCRRDVEAARDRWRHALADGGKADAGSRERLRGLASRLEEAAPGLQGRAGAAAAQAAREVRLLAEGPGDRRRQELRLQAREAELVAALAEAAGTEALAAYQASIERDLLPYRERMPARVLGQIRSESLARLLLESCGLPRLSLLES